MVGSCLRLLLLFSIRILHASYPMNFSVGSLAPTDATIWYPRGVVFTDWSFTDRSPMRVYY